MKIAFTICSNNYLAQAKTLGCSLLRENPDWLFFICLCDKKHPTIDYEAMAPMRVIEVSELGIGAFEAMCGRYTIIELNTSIKPFAFAFFFKTCPEVELVVYLDPDTRVYAPLTEMENEVRGHTGLLTPHICTPLEFDGATPTENDFTLFGVYNLGFLALRPVPETWALLNWWMRRMEINCYNRPDKGIFVDQLPMTLAVIFFKELRASANMGLNMASWNLHERALSQRDGRYWVNGGEPLVFFHFTKFRPGSGTLTAARYTRRSQGDEKAMESLCLGYEKELIDHNYNMLCGISCAYGLKTPPTKPPFWRKMLRSWKKRLGQAT